MIRELRVWDWTLEEGEGAFNWWLPLDSALFQDKYLKDDFYETMIQKEGGKWVAYLKDQELSEPPVEYWQGIYQVGGKGPEVFGWDVWEEVNLENNWPYVPEIRAQELKVKVGSNWPIVDNTYGEQLDSLPLECPYLKGWESEWDHWYVGPGGSPKGFVPLDAPVDVTPAQSYQWVDVDVSSYVPFGATGAILHVHGTEGSSYPFRIRKNGSSDDYDTNLWGTLGYTVHQWAIVGLDENGVFEMYKGGGATGYLVGYTGYGITMFDNSVNKTPVGGLNNWVNVDCSGDATNAIGLIFMVHSSTGSSLKGYFGLRNDGSSDDRTGYLGSGTRTMSWVIVGCSSSQVVEFRRTEDTTHLYLLGYITSESGATFFTNGVNKSLSVTETWTDIDCSDVAPGATILFFEEWGNTGAYYFGMRKNGSSEDIYYSGGQDRSWPIVACDENQVVEGKISSTYCDFFLLGYAH